MDNIINQRIRVPVKWHIIGWVLLVFIYYAFLITVLKDSFGNFVDFAFFIFFNVLVFYFNVLWLLPKSIRDSNKALYRVPLYLLSEVLGLVVLLALVSLALGGLTLNLIEKPYGIFIWNFFEILFPFSYGLFLSLVYHMVLCIVKQKKAKDKVKRKNDRLTHEVEISRQNWLKAQLDPHLLFNILPMLRYTMEHSPEEAAKALAILNKMMRYYLRKTANGLIPLADEINQVRNLMALNQIRWGENQNVKLIISGEDDNLQTIPMILLVLVENMYKYGVLGDEAQPAILEVKRSKDNLFIYAENLIKDSVDVVSTGIGLRNLKERLDHFYPCKHTFKAGAKGDVFVVSLELEVES